MTAYATRSDVYRYGLSRGALGNSGRLVESALAADDTVELESHGFATDDPIVFRASEGGTLPTPLVEGATYYAIYVNDSTFQIAATPEGSAIDLTVDGVNVVVSTPLPFDEVLEFYSRFVDAFLPAHAVPLTSPYPVTVVALVAELSAKKLQNIAGQSSVSMSEVELAAKAQLERWAAGIPLRDPNATVATNLAISQPAAVGGCDPRGWGSDRLP